jgi:thermitase
VIETQKFFSTQRAVGQTAHVVLAFIAMLAVVTVTLFIPQTATAAPLAQSAELQATETQSLLVHLDSGSTPEMRSALVAQMGGELVTWMPQINVAEISVPVYQSAMAASLPMVANELVTYAENDMVVEAAAVFSDPDLSDETMSYGLDHVQALDAWNVITGSQEIIIAVIDSGIKLDHPEFAGRLVAGYDFVNNDDQPDDDMGHGTHVAGILSAGLNNGQGVAGVCPNCRLMPVKVLNQNNMGTWSQLAQGILFATDNGAQVINLSLGATVPSETLAAAVEYAQAHGVIVVAAAGNNGTDAPFYPAALDGVIAVGATNAAGERWTRSNYGTFVDIVAPGALIYSTYNDLNNLYHGYTYMSGTSMAAPFVSGVVGLLLSADRALTSQQVTDALIDGADDLGVVGVDTEFANGRVNAMGSLMAHPGELAGKFGVVANPEQSVKMFLPVLSNH